MDKLISNAPPKIFMFTLLLLISSVLSLKISKMSHKPSHLVTYKDNLQAKNWYYGNLTSVTYRLRLFKAATVEALSPCSLSLPFTSIDMKQCQNCPPDKPLRNLEKQVCQACPSSEKYDPLIGNCSKLNNSIEQISTENSVITNSQEVISGKQTTIAPVVVNPVSTQPLAPVVKIQIPPNKNKQDSSKNLTSVKQEEKKILVTNNSIQKAEFNQSSTEVKQSISANQTSQNKTIQITNQTVKAQNLTTLNMTMNKTTVISNSNVTEIQSKSTTNQAVNTKQNINSILAQKNSTQQIRRENIPVSNSSNSSNNFDNKITSIQKAKAQNINNTSQPSNTESNNIKSQVSISSKQIAGQTTYQCKGIYNLTTKECLPCPSQTQYIQLSDSCLPIIYVPNIQIATSRLIQPKKNYLQDQSDHIKSQHPTRKLHVCNENTPFLSVSSGLGICISCPNNQYFVVLTEKCTKGCQLGTIYNNADKTCQPGRFYTNPESSNLLSPSQAKYQAWKNLILKQKSEISGNKFCPNETPFEVNNICINCNSTFPYFNFDLQKCVECGTGRSYNSQQRKCKAYFNGEVSIQRMIANIL